MRLHEHCQGSGCNERLPADRQLYCSARCARRARMQRYRAANEREPFAEMIEALEYHAEAFGVETSPVVAWIFADDDERFADAKRRGHTEASRRQQKPPRHELSRHYGET